MPKTEIDYSNTIIYKITCKDPIVTDVYVGHTTNFVQRKHAHKQSCINDKSPNYKCKLYEVIRNNGGWINWKMEIINFFECHDHYEARKKEQEYFISLNATLNSIEPMPKPKPKEIIIKKEVVKETFFCEKCNIHCSSLNLLEKHNETKKHKKENIKMPNNDNTIICEKCDFKCFKLSNYEKHILTRKHISAYANLPPKIEILNYSCKCGKDYKFRQSLYTHKKTCQAINHDSVNSEIQDPSNNGVIQVLLKENYDFKSMLVEMMKSNTDLQKQMIEICKKINN
jgi:hypothetical protein